MPRKRRLPGLDWREDRGCWQIRKVVDGQRIRANLRFGRSEYAKAEARALEIIEDARRHAHQPVTRHTFRDAAARYLEENRSMRSIADVALHLRQVDPFIGALPLASVHDGTLAPFVLHEERRGMRPKTIRNALAVVRRVLNLSARAYRDELGEPWLDRAPPLLTMPRVAGNQKPAYPLSWPEQDRLLRELRAPLARIVLYLANTGLREQECLGLRWDWEREVEGIGRVFVLPASITKNGEPRVVLHNGVARSVLEEQRAERHLDSPFVWHLGGRRRGKVNNTAWRRAWRAAELPVEDVLHGVHNLRHTFARRLRAAGVPVETRAALLGHSDMRLVERYSHFQAEHLDRVVSAIGVARSGPRSGPKDSENT